MDYSNAQFANVLISIYNNIVIYNDKEPFLWRMVDIRGVKT